LFQISETALDHAIASNFPPGTNLPSSNCERDWALKLALE